MTFSKGYLDMSKKVAFTGLALALALVLSYVESLFSFSAIPGIKLGLANIAALFLLYCFGLPYALLVNVLRIILANLLFGSLTGMFYGLTGGILSVFVMWLLIRTGRFSATGLSVAGSAAHNIGQLCAAALLLSSARVFWYLPVLLFSGAFAGFFTGVCCQAVLRTLKLNTNQAGRYVGRK